MKWVHKAFDLGASAAGEMAPPTLRSPVSPIVARKRKKRVYGRTSATSRGYVVTAHITDACFVVSSANQRDKMRGGYFNPAVSWVSGALHRTQITNDSGKPTNLAANMRAQWLHHA